jgi:hypothetical protein
VLPLPPGAARIDRLDHAAFDTADAEALRVYLAAKGVSRARQGSRPAPTAAAGSTSSIPRA